MSIFLVMNTQSPYYESETFDKLLSFVKKYPRRCNLREANSKRSVVIKDVPTVETACRILEEMAGM